MATEKKKPPKQKSGPKPETIKIEGNWENAVWKALKKERPKEGWPKRAEKTQMKAIYSKFLAWRKAVREAKLLRLIRSLEYDGAERSLEEGMKRAQALDEARRQYLREKFPNFKG